MKYKVGNIVRITKHQSFREMNRFYGYETKIIAINEFKSNPYYILEIDNGE